MIVTKTTGIVLTLLGPMSVAVTLGTLVMDSTAVVSSLLYQHTLFHIHSRAPITLMCLQLLSRY